MRTFTWKVRKDLTREPQLNVKVVQFGDGYEQRQKTVLGNRVMSKFSFTFKAKAATADAAYTFLLDHMGVEPFLWTPPTQPNAITVVCDDFRYTQYDGINHQISGTFREVKN